MIQNQPISMIIIVICHRNQSINYIVTWKNNWTSNIIFDNCSIHSLDLYTSSSKGVAGSCFSGILSCWSYMDDLLFRVTHNAPIPIDGRGWGESFYQNNIPLCLVQHVNKMSYVLSTCPNENVKIIMQYYAFERENKENRDYNIFFSSR